MPTNYKVLGQVNPTQNTQTNVYVVPAATEAVISSITICNYRTENAFYSLAVMPPGSYSNPASNASYYVLGGIIPSVETIVLTIGLTGNAGTVFIANTSHSNVSINMFGSEIT
jgi:hypothetical protein